MFYRVPNTPQYFHQKNVIVVVVKEITTNVMKQIKAIIKYIIKTNSNYDHSSKNSRNKRNVNNAFLINSFKDLLKDTNAKNLDFYTQKNALKNQIFSSPNFKVVLRIY